MDSVVVEIFAGGAHVVHVLEAIDGVALPGTGVEVGAVGGSAGVDVDLWAMAPSISPACPHECVFFLIRVRCGPDDRQPLRAGVINPC